MLRNVFPNTRECAFHQKLKRLGNRDAEFTRKKEQEYIHESRVVFPSLFPVLSQMCCTSNVNVLSSLAIFGYAVLFVVKTIGKIPAT